MTVKKSTKMNKILLLVLFLLCSVVWFGTAPKKSVNNSPPQQRSGIHKWEATNQCHKFIVEKHTTLQDNFFETKAGGIRGEPVTHYAVTGIVLLSDGYKKYRCDLHHQSDDTSRWTLDSLTIE